MERTITHLAPRLDTVLGVVIGWQGRVTLTQNGIEAMNIIEMQIAKGDLRPLAAWTQAEAVDAFARALDAADGHAAAQMRQLVHVLQSRVRYPLLENFRFPED